MYIGESIDVFCPSVFVNKVAAFIGYDYIIF